MQIPQGDLMKSRGKKPRTGTVRLCDVCGKEFYSGPCRAEKAKFCSMACRHESVRLNAEKTCQTCGKVFTQGGLGRKYCSFACYHAHRVPLKNCKVCGAQLSVIRLTYCSRTCMLQGQYSRIEKECGYCGKSFTHEKGAANSRFCSRDCANKGRRLKGPGHKSKRKDGYIAVYHPTHPNAKGNGTVLEHRLVMEQVLGRYLEKNEQVHHKNGDRSDNRPENLELVDPANHTRMTNERTTAKRRKDLAELDEYRKRFGNL